MAGSIDYTTDQLDQISQLSTYIEEYCSTHGIDPSVYTSALDGEIDIDLKNDPAFQAYWQLAYLQLMEMLDPSLVCSVEASVGAVDFDTLYASADSDMNDYIEKMLADDPELMAFYAMQSGQGGDAQSLLDALNANSSSTQTAVSATSSSARTSSDSESTGGAMFMTYEDMSEKDYSYVDEDARDIYSTYGLDDSYDWLIGTTEGMRSAENSILGQLSEMDQTLVELTDALNTGEMGSDEYNAKVSELSANRETYLAMFKQLEDSLSLIIEMYNDMVKQSYETSASINQNLRGG